MFPFAYKKEMLYISVSVFVFKKFILNQQLLLWCPSLKKSWIIKNLYNFFNMIWFSLVYSFCILSHSSVLCPPPLFLRSLSLHPSVCSHDGVRGENSRRFHDGSSSCTEDEEGLDAHGEEAVGTLRRR